MVLTATFVEGDVLSRTREGHLTAAAAASSTSSTTIIALASTVAWRSSSDRSKTDFDLAPVRLEIGEEEERTSRPANSKLFIFCIATLASFGSLNLHRSVSYSTRTNETKGEEDRIGGGRDALYKCEPLTLPSERIFVQVHQVYVTERSKHLTDVGFCESEIQ